MEMIKFIPGSRLYPDIKHTYDQRMSEMFASDETQTNKTTGLAYESEGQSQSQMSLWRE